jgi:hypothetical protein
MWKMKRSACLQEQRIIYVLCDYLLSESYLCYMDGPSWTGGDGAEATEDFLALGEWFVQLP